MEIKNIKQCGLTYIRQEGKDKAELIDCFQAEITLHHTSLFLQFLLLRF